LPDALRKTSPSERRWCATATALIRHLIKLN
jgi:hypothetical protein